MQNSVCKRIARSFELQRYIPEYQVYELCINWESEIPIPPTIFYLSEIFIYPYTVHELPNPIKNELTAPNKFFIDSDTMVDHDNSTALYRTSKSQFGSFGVATLDHESKAESSRVLDYDRMLMSKATLNQIKARNRQVVRHNDLRSASDSRKRRKT